MLPHEPDLIQLINQSLTTSFGDATAPRTFRLDDVEVLACIPDATSDGGLTEVGKDFKFAYYRSLVKKRKHSQLSRWDDVISQASVFIFDPKKVIGLLVGAPEYAHVLGRDGALAAEVWLERRLCWHAAHLMPEVWLHAMALRDGYLLWADPAFEDVPENAALIVAHADWKIVNVRRVLLKSQNLYRSILSHRPIRTLFDSTSFKGNLEMPVRKLVVAVTPSAVYDAGHSRDMLLLEGGRKKARSRMDDFAMAHPLPPYVPGVVSERDSKADFRIQAADVAAGKARHLYETVGLTDVRKFFREVYVNGEQIT